MGNYRRPAGAVLVVALSGSRFSGIPYLGRQLRQSHFFLARRNLQVQQRRQNHSAEPAGGECGGSEAVAALVNQAATFSEMTRTLLIRVRSFDLNTDLRVSLPSFSLKESPRQTTVVPARLAIQTSKAIEVAERKQWQQRQSPWRSRKTDHPTTRATAYSQAHRDCQQAPCPESAAAQQQRQQRPGQAEGHHQSQVSPATRIAHGAAPAQLVVDKLAQRVGRKISFDHHIGQLDLQSLLRRCAGQFRSRPPDNPTNASNPPMAARSRRRKASVEPSPKRMPPSSCRAASTPAEKSVLMPSDSSRDPRVRAGTPR